MSIAAFVDFFIHPYYHKDAMQHRRARLLVRSSLLTSLFSTSYIWLSIYFEYPKGIYFMAFNVCGFLLLPFLVKTKIPLQYLTNLFVLIGAVAVVALTYFSGGIWSGIYPWIISIPVLAALVANRQSGIFWTIVCFSIMAWFGIEAINGREFPREYNTEMHTLWYVTIVPGLLLIIMVVTLVFESMQSRTLSHLEAKNQLLEEQKETIARQSGKLQGVIQDKEQIIQIMAHDLKNPLSNITMLVNLLREEKDPEQYGKYLEMIQHAASNAHSLVGKVLEMDHLEQGTKSVELDTVPVDEVLKEVLAGIEENARKKDIQVIGEEVNGHVMADRTYLHQILENLISNAVKFSPEGKTIQIATENHTSQSIRIKVIDQGPGILPEEQNRLFVKYSQLSSRPTGGESSTGLGLSLVKKYVEQMNGKTWHEENPAGGSVFVVELPVG